MHVSHTKGLGVTTLILAVSLGLGRSATAQALTAGGPTLAPTGVQPQISANALSQIAALKAEKAERTPAQQKIDSNLLRAALLARADTVTTRPQTVPSTNAALKATTLSAATLNVLKTIPISEKAQPDVNGMVSVDIQATVTADLLTRISAVGGVVTGSWPAFDSVRASLPITQLETVAAAPTVRSIRPAEEAHVVRSRATPLTASGLHPGPLVPAPATPAARRGRVKAALPALLDRVRASRTTILQGTLDLPFFRLAALAPPPVSSADPEGDSAQRAALARTTYGVDGSGIKIGVLSNSVDGLAAEQVAGRLGPVTVLPGQGSSGTGEGTAMLEIINRLAPGAQLYFATANGGQAQFAANILALQQAGCNVIVDDVAYFAEPPFQDGVINQAIDAVSAAGAFYFSSAGNNYNLDQEGVTAAWEGDWRASGMNLNNGTTLLPTLAYDTANDFGDQVTVFPNARQQQYVFLFWADPQGGATDDYDIYVFDSTFSSTLYASTNTQNGTQDPIEACEADQGNQVVVVKAGGNGVLLHLAVTSNGAAYLNHSTPSGIVGHAGATTCYAVAAADASIPYRQGRAFQSSDVTETFSSDGLRRVLFTTAGAEITPGNRSSTGGVVRQKPVLTGSDGVSTFPPHFAPFYGTSAAAPHDAAIAGLALSADPALVSHSAQMFGLLTSSCIPIDTVFGALPNQDAGYGILDAYAAVGQAVAAATPTATPQSVATSQGTPTSITLTGSDPNNRALTYAVVTAPAHGTLSGTAPSLTYTPTAGYTGPDSFTFTASNGAETSAPATVSLTVGSVVLSSLTFPSPVPGGTVVTATVTLSGTTPSDVVVGLSSSNSAIVRLHRAVIVPAGASSATFQVNTFRSHISNTVTIQASLNGVVKAQDLTITGR